MFFKNIRRSAAKNRKNNGIFFTTLIIAVIAFYTLLSLESQDVMRFLKQIESEAVGKMLTLIPIIYVISLFFVFFLVYFAYRYQLSERRREFGIYLMLGMRRSKLLLMLMFETGLNSLYSLLIGLPAALLLTEGVSLATSSIVGIGILGHQVTLSLSAVLGTVVGFVGVQFAAMLILSAKLCRMQPMELLNSAAPEKQKTLSYKKGIVLFSIGITLLASSYTLAIMRFKYFDMLTTLIILILCCVGTFFLFRGMGAFIGQRLHKKGKVKTGLYVFTTRQVQENVSSQHASLAVSSLLLVMALSCMSFGAAFFAQRNENDVKTVDFTIRSDENLVKNVLNSPNNSKYIETYYPLFTDSIRLKEDGYNDGHTFSWGNMISSLKSLPITEQNDNPLIYLQDAPDIISLSSYNEILKSNGKVPITLNGRSVAYYMISCDSDWYKPVSTALSQGAYVEVDGEKYDILPTVYTDKIVADRSLTLFKALIVPDDCYKEWANNRKDEPFCWNVVLKPELVQQKGLFGAISTLNENLKGSGLEYESYMQSIGRKLFYTVSAGYLSIYLGILFLLIANTVIGLKYLIGQRTSRRRYLTLSTLGAGSEAIIKASKKQIRLYFALVISVAVVTSVFVLISLFTSILPGLTYTSILDVSLLCAAAFILLIIFEIIYIAAVGRASAREIRLLTVSDRG